MPKPHRMKKRAVTRYIAVHATATDPLYHGPTTLEDLRRWHMKERGWIDIGYNLFIPRSGVIQIARADEYHGIMDDLEIQGAHVRGYNHEAFAICYDGGVRYDEEKDLFVPEFNATEKQERALVAAIAMAQIKYPHAELLGHRDFPGVAKACPSFDVRSWWEINRPPELI